jgi:hypothetical protein
VHDDLDVAGEVLAFIDNQGVLSVIMRDGIILAMGNGGQPLIAHSGAGATALRGSSQYARDQLRTRSAGLMLASNGWHERLGDQEQKTTVPPPANAI